MSDGRISAAFAVVRTPLLSRAVAERFVAALGDGDADARFLEDRRRLHALIDELLADPWVAQAVALGSPGIVDTYRAERATPKGVREATFTALFSFILRMCGRATPFGLFAGLSILEIGNRSAIEIVARDHYESHFRLDMQYLFEVERSLLRDPEARARLRFVANETIVRRATRLTYVSDRLVGEARTHALVTYERSEPLDRALETAGTGASPSLIVSALVADGNDEPDAQAFVEQLIDERLLVPRCRPPVVGRDPALQMADALEADGLTRVAEQLRAVVARTAALRAGRPGFEGALAEALATRPPVTGEPRVVHSDMVKPVVEGVLSRRLISDIALCVDAMHRISGAEVRLSRLAKFTSKFSERYGDRAVPLLEAIDAERGIGFTAGYTAPAPGPLLDGLPFFQSGDGVESAKLTPRDAFLLERARNAWAKGELQIDISDEDLKSMTAPTPSPPLPATLMATVRLERESDREPWSLFFLGATGPSSMRMLGRFAHVDPKLAGLVDAELAFEAQSYAPAVVAEVVYTPEGRVGNTVVRQLRREHSIVAAGSAGDAGPPLDLTKLVLQLDPSGRLRMYSTELQREVLPRSTTAHNPFYAGSVLYGFLGVFEREGITSFVTWSWGALATAGFLPRVRYRGITLARARWQIPADADGLGPVIAAKTDAEAHRAVAAMQAKHRVPRQVGLVQGENVLPIDLDNIMCIDLLRRDKGGVVFEELGARESIAHGPEGRYAAELQVPLRLPASQTRLGPPPSAFSPVPKPMRRFAPTSSWTYAKIYLPPDEADDVLLDTIAPCLETALQRSDIATWFFIRYDEGGRHLRVRWQHEGTTSLALAETLIKRLEAHRSATIERVVLDTYEREVERYGGPSAIQAAEQLFGADSSMVVSLLRQVSPDANDDLRWRFGLFALEDLAKSLMPDVEQRLELYRRNRAAFARELKVASGHERVLSARTRALRPDLIDLMSASPLPDLAVAELERRRELARVYAARVAAPLLASVTTSMVHMMCNRIFANDARAQEFVLWDYAARGLDGWRVQDRRQRSVLP